MSVDNNSYHGEGAGNRATAADNRAVDNRVSAADRGDPPGDSAATLPKLTVIIPTHNRARYLDQAIRSALGQTYGDFELIVVDDGSTDTTVELVGAYRDRRLRYLSQPHRGISAAVNLGIRSARGCYIARLDSDDLWFPDMLATLVPVLDAEPEIGVVYGRGQGIDHAGRRLPHTLGLPERFPGDSLRSLLYDVQPTDPVAYIGVSLLLLLVALLASYLPARQAAKIDPIVALRCE